MSGGKGGGSQQVVQRADPWSGQQPYLTTGFQQAQNYLNQPTSTVAPLAPQTLQALQMQQNRALQGSPLIGMGQGQIADTLAGDYMTGGPGFEAFTDAALSAVKPQTDASFALGGRSGSPLHAEAMGRGFGRAMAPLYNAERGRQMQAAFGAPGMAAADYQDISQLANVGGVYQNQLQQMLNEPLNRLSNYMGIVGGQNWGGTTTQTGGAGYNPLMGALGGGMAGAGLGNMLGLSSPWGWGLAGLGALGGLLG